MISTDKSCLIEDTSGNIMYFSKELMAINSVFLVLLAIMSILVLINRIDPNNNFKNALLKIMFGGLTIVSLVGILYPIEFGLIGVNIMMTIILAVDFYIYKKEDNDNRE